MTPEGKTDHVSFFERVEEIRLRYDAALPSCLTETLYIATVIIVSIERRGETSGATLKISIFTSLSHLYRISQRVQRESESVANYVITLQTLMRQHGRHRNLLSENCLYLRKPDYRIVADLVKTAKEYDGIYKDI